MEKEPHGLRGRQSGEVLKEGQDSGASWAAVRAWPELGEGVVQWRWTKALGGLCCPLLGRRGPGAPVALPSVPDSRAAQALHGGLRTDQCQPQGGSPGCSHSQQAPAWPSRAWVHPAADCPSTPGWACGGAGLGHGHNDTNDNDDAPPVVWLCPEWHVLGTCARMWWGSGGAYAVQIAGKRRLSWFAHCDSESSLHVTLWFLITNQKR